jgi:protein-disulfide isomerase
MNEATVRAVLRANPEIILEALQIIQSRRADMSRAQQRAAIVASRELLLEDANSVVGGNPQGDVTVVEFFDYRCPYCRQTLATVRQLIKADPKVRVVYKEFPALGPESLTASRLAVAARNDPRYEALHAALMTAPSPLDENAVLQIASALGFDRTTMASAMAAPEIEDILQANHALARTLGLQGTPAFIVGDMLIPGVATLDELKRLVAQLRAKGGDDAIGKTDG